MQAYTAPAVPAILASAPNWLTWRLLYQDEKAKPRKVPYWVKSGEARSGEQGGAADRAQLVTLDEAASAVRASQGRYAGVGFAVLPGCGIVALDFDDCVSGDDINPDVEALCEGTYYEISPSGTGLRAFFAGSVPSNKDVDAKLGPFPLEVFGNNGFVTVTGKVAPKCEMFGWCETIAPLSDAVRAELRRRGWADQAAIDLFADDGEEADLAGLMGLEPKLGLDAIQVAAMLSHLPNDLDYDTWVRTGQSVHHELGDEGWEVWHGWSKNSPKYTNEKYCWERWRSFGKNGDRRPATMHWIERQTREARQEIERRAKHDALNSWRKRIADTADHYELREKIAPAIRAEATLDDLDRKVLARCLQDAFSAAGTKLPIGECRALVERPEQEKKPNVTLYRPLTEYGNADRMLDKFAHELMFVPEMDTWFTWTGVYWRKAHDIQIEYLAKLTVRALPNEADQHNDSQEFYAFCSISQTARMTKNMVTLAACDPRVTISARELDKHTHLLGVKNGVVDLTTGQLLPASPIYRITNVCGCEFAPNAPAKLFEQTVSEVFGNDAAVVDYFHRAIGYSATGNPKEQVLFIPFGNGANGKGTVLHAIRKALGDYACSADPGTFICDGKAGNAGGAREDVLRLKGSRFVYVNEPDENGELREGSVKSMTGGDTLTARGLYSKNTVEITPSWVVWMPTNHKPIVKGNDNGIWRRLVLLPFTQDFEHDPVLKLKKDKELSAKLEREQAGILAWIIRGALRYGEAGLVPPDSVRAAREAYRTQMDLLAEWMDECCETGAGYEEPMAKLWASWEQFAKNRGIINYVRTSVALGRRLDSRFSARKGTGGVRMRVGIRLKDDFRGAGVAQVAVDALFR